MSAAALAVAVTRTEAAPSAFSLVAPAADGYVATATPVLEWSPAMSAAGIDEYEVYVDGQLLAYFEPADCDSTCAGELNSALSQGRHTWQIVAVDGANERTPSALGAFTVDTRAPVVGFETTPERRVDNHNCAAPNVTPAYPSALAAFSSFTALRPQAVFTVSDATATTFALRVDGVAVTTLCGLAGGTHALSVTATDAAGNATSASKTIRVDTVSPAVRIDGPVRAATGVKSGWTAVVAEGSAVGDVRYRWQAPGGASSSSVMSSSSVLIPPAGLKRTIRVYVADAEGDWGMASLEVTSGGRKPPTGAVGLSSRHASRYVNDRDVLLKLIWPSGAATYTLSDSSGAQGTATNVYRSNVTWRLGGSGKVKRMTTVRARFDWPEPNKAYEVDVMLDLERPTLTRATLAGGRLQLKAGDRVSGLDRVQLAVNRSKPRSVAYRRSVVAGNAKWVRVRDRAGNVSRWLRIKR